MDCWYEPDPSLKKDEDNKRRATLLVQETKQIEERQSAWYELNLWNATIYNNRVLAGFRWGADEDMTQELWPANLRTENIVENIGQAMLSKASSNPLKPTLVPHGNSWKVAKSVRRADRFLFGAWRQTKAENACVEMFNDAYTAGLGCVEVVYDNDCLHTQSVFFDNIVIDNRECANRAAPRTYRIRQMVQRSAVEALYGKEIAKQKDNYLYNDKRQQGRDWVPLVKAWRMPDRSGKGGRFSIACMDLMLQDEEWNDDFVPLVFMPWMDRQSGFFGKGGVEQLIPFQVLQNELNEDIKEAQAMACRFKVLVHANSNMSMDQWDNANGRIVTYSGIEPKPWESKTNLNELYAERERNKAAAYSHMGLSEMFANADIPQQVRLDSSAAVREQRNMEDSRHLRLWTVFEEKRVEVARTMLLVLARAGASAHNYSTSTFGNRADTRKIPYKDIKDLTNEMYSWTLEPVPMSMMSPASRRELLRDKTSRAPGQEADDAKRTLGNPDLEMLEDLELANREDIERHLGLMEEDDYEEPTEFTALSMGLMMVNANMKRLLQYDDVKYKDKVIQLHIRWMVKAASLIKNAEKMQQQQQMEQQQQMTAFAPTQGVQGTSAAQAS